ncbi:hypothetical protein [Haladaptatus litoreus]|uniref:hypothetical protein n=1 Tax=Haladaptatus litoreus TaxID=553468 RepID=UPI00158BE760|nr:hypothetical protein [Haladaptatus litoreus]
MTSQRDTLASRTTRGCSAATTGKFPPARSSNCQPTKVQPPTASTPTAPRFSLHRR